MSNEPRNCGSRIKIDAFLTFVVIFTFILPEDYDVEVLYMNENLGILEQMMIIKMIVIWQNTIWVSYAIYKMQNILAIHETSCTTNVGQFIGNQQKKFCHRRIAGLGVLFYSVISTCHYSYASKSSTKSFLCTVWHTCLLHKKISPALLFLASEK